MMKTVAESCQRKAWLGEWLVLKEVKEMAAWGGIMSKRCLCYFPWEVCVCDETKLCGMWPEWANMHCVQALPGLIPGGSKSLLGSSGRGVHCSCISCYWCGWDGEGLWELHVPVGSLSWSWALLVASAGCWLPRAKVRAEVKWRCWWVQRELFVQESCATCKGSQQMWDEVSDFPIALPSATTWEVSWGKEELPPGQVLLI